MAGFPDFWSEKPYVMDDISWNEFYGRPEEPIDQSIIQQSSVRGDYDIVKNVDLIVEHIYKYYKK